MTRQEFLVKLEIALANIPTRERKDILYDYEEHFVSGIASGKSEPEIVTALGNPETIAKEILAEYHVAQAVKNISFDNIVRALLATISLGFFNLLFVLGPLFIFIGLLVTLYFAVIVLIFVPVLMPLKVGVSSGVSGILLWLFTSMITVGAGTLLGVGLVLFTCWASKMFLKYLQFNMRIIRGR